MTNQIPLSLALHYNCVFCDVHIQCYKYMYMEIGEKIHWSSHSHLCIYTFNVFELSQGDLKVNWDIYIQHTHWYLIFLYIKKSTTKNIYRLCIAFQQKWTTKMNYTSFVCSVWKSLKYKCTLILDMVNNRHTAT